MRVVVPVPMANCVRRHHHQLDVLIIVLNVIKRTKMETIKIALALFATMAGTLAIIKTIEYLILIIKLNKTQKNESI